MDNPVFIEKIHLRNFKSIRNQTVTFDNPLFLVGQNNTGKSNFIDVFDFIAECMKVNLGRAMEQFGHPHFIYRHGDYDIPQGFYMGLRIDFKFSIDSLSNGFYSFSYGPVFSGDKLAYFGVRKEQLCIINQKDEKQFFNRLRNDHFESNFKGIVPNYNMYGLIFPLISGIEPLSTIYKFFSSMGVYSLEPDRIRETPNSSDIGLLMNNLGLLNRDGSNLAAIYKHIEKNNELVLQRINEFLVAIVPGLSHVHVESAGGKDILQFIKVIKDGKYTSFNASEMSDGTLRALALIIAAMQAPPPSLIAIEEPELYIHPGALGVIADIIQMASERSQVVVTTHSPDLLDAKWIKPENLRIVTWENDSTHISELGNASKKSLQQHLMGAGELLRANALEEAPIIEDEEDDFADDLFEPV
jgi:predicted ATPase